MPRKKSVVQHSWSINGWPSEVFPNTPARGRQLIRANRDELVAGGALARVGRELIVLGDRYARWLELKTANVPGYVPAPNRDRAPSRAD